MLGVWICLSKGRSSETIMLWESVESPKASPCVCPLSGEGTFTTSSRGGARSSTAVLAGQLWCCIAPSLVPFLLLSSTVSFSLSGGRTAAVPNWLVSCNCFSSTWANQRFAVGVPNVITRVLEPRNGHFGRIGGPPLQMKSLSHRTAQSCRSSSASTSRKYTARLPLMPECRACKAPTQNCMPSRDSPGART